MTAMDYPVKIYEVAHNASPGDAPKLIETTTQRADSVDDARAKLRARLADRQIRAISATAEGRAHDQVGFVAYVYAREGAPAPAPARKSTMLESEAKHRGVR